jgi:protein phosphatase
LAHSRAYLLREGRLIQLTRDHTLRWKEANGAPARPLMDVSHSASDLTHVITETVGMSGLVEPQIDIERFRVRDNDVVLLCTNGLTDVVDETAIADVLASGRSPNEISARLVELAESSEDDVTAVVARYQLPE